MGFAVFKRITDKIFKFPMLIFFWTLRNKFTIRVPRVALMVRTVERRKGKIIDVEFSCLFHKTFEIDAFTNMRF